MARLGRIQHRVLGFLWRDDCQESFFYADERQVLHSLLRRGYVRRIPEFEVPGRRWAITEAGIEAYNNHEERTS